MSAPIKTEGGGKKPMFKPKFVPKVPVKTESTSEGAAQSSSSSGGAVTSGDASSGRDKGKNNSRSGGGRQGGRSGRGGGRWGDNKDGSGRDGRGGRSGRGGRGHWVMPQGVAFFTGNNTGGSATSSALQRTSIPIGGTGLTSSSARSTSEVHGGGGAERTTADGTGGAKSSAAVQFMDDNFYHRAPAGEFDSDLEDTASGINGAEGDGEDWPPANYSSAAPLSLPFGPKSLTVRERLANAPILADPNDQEALQREEESTLILMQMPSSLRFPSFSSATGESSSAAIPLDDVGAQRAAAKALQNTATSKPGHVGKMQLLRSGKVRIITNDGKIYEVNSGIAVAFAQYLGSIDMKEKISTSNSSSSSNSNRDVKPDIKPVLSAGGKGFSMATAAAVSGEMHVMGRVTHKIVVTPLEDDCLQSATATTTTTSDGDTGAASVDEQQQEDSGPMRED